MSDDREFWRATNEWLEAGSDRTPTQATDAVFLAIRTTRRERVRWGPWRTIDMTLLARVAAAAVAVLVIGVAWVNLGPTGDNTGGGPAPTASPTPTPRPFPSGDWPSLAPESRYVTTEPFPIPVSFTVPAGWIGNIGGPYAVFLGPATGLDRVWFQMVDDVPADPCRSEGAVLDTGPGTAEELADALANQPGGEVTTPTDITLGGYSGKRLTLTGPDNTAACDGGVYRAWQLPFGFNNDLVPGQRQHLWVLDVDGRRLVIVTLEQPNDSPAVLADIQGVIDSIVIGP